MRYNQKDIIRMTGEYIDLIHKKKLCKYEIKSGYSSNILIIKNDIFELLSQISLTLTGEKLEKSSDIWYHLKVSIIKYSEAFNILNTSEYIKLWKSKKIIKSLLKINPNNNQNINDLIEINLHMSGMYEDYMRSNMCNGSTISYHQSKIDYFTLEFK
jgi:hypothetical protein